MQYYVPVPDIGYKAEMRIILFMAVLLPSIACATEWVELGETPAARIMLDKKGTETFRKDATAWLQFIYHNEQPGQNVTKGKPFDSSINQYFVDCSKKKFQVLQLVLYSKNEKVGDFQQQLNLENLDEPKLGSAATLLLAKLCPTNVPDTGAQKK